MQVLGTEYTLWGWKTRVIDYFLLHITSKYDKYYSVLMKGNLDILFTFLNKLILYKTLPFISLPHRGTNIPFANC